MRTNQGHSKLKETIGTLKVFSFHICRYQNLVDLVQFSLLSELMRFKPTMWSRGYNCSLPQHINKTLGKCDISFCRWTMAAKAVPSVIIIIYQVFITISVRFIIIIIIIIIIIVINKNRFRDSF